MKISLDKYTQEESSVLIWCVLVLVTSQDWLKYEKNMFE